MLEVVENLEKTLADLSPAVLVGWGIVCVLAGLIVWLGGLGFRKVIIVVLMAGLGAALVFAGMVLLLQYKGAAPLSYISSRGAFFLGIWMIMTVFGSFVQLLFGRRTRKEATAKPANKDKEN